MSGHSQFKNIMYRKGARDRRKAKIFTKLTREIMVSAKLGSSDTEYNHRLRSAVAEARAQNMPKDTIERAIKKSLETSGKMYNEVRYEGFCSGGAGIIVDALTDNRHRTASDVRAVFAKYGGNLGETGSVSFMFDHCGQIVYACDIGSFDDIFSIALENEFDDCRQEDGQFFFLTSSVSLVKKTQILEEKFNSTPQSAFLIWAPKTEVVITKEKQALSFMKIVDNLDDHDDVQRVYYNAVIDYHLLDKFNTLI